MILKPPTTIKWGFLLLLSLSVLVFTVIQLSISPLPLRSKTLLLINNKYLCNYRPSALIHSRNRSIVAKESNQKSIVFLVPSAKNNFKRRLLIRQTYGSIRSINNVRILAIVFTLGLDTPGEMPIDMKDLETENEQFGDIVIGEFVDSYRNLSIKTIMGYEWLTSFCQEAQFVVKTDDDVVVNIFKLTEEIDAFSSTDVTSSNIWCALHFNEGVVTDPNSQYYASPFDFPDHTFPTHCAGVGYVTTISVIHRIIDEIRRSFLGRICTHEDVFITGIVTRKINSLPNCRPIKLIDKLDQWVIYCFENDNRLLLEKMIGEAANKTDTLEEFGQRLGTKVFYLLPQNEEFEERFMKIWQFIENNFENKTRP